MNSTSTIINCQYQIKIDPQVYKCMSAEEYYNYSNGKGDILYGGILITFLLLIIGIFALYSLVSNN